MRIQPRLNVWLKVMLRRYLSGDAGEKRPIYRRSSNRSDGGRDAQRGRWGPSVLIWDARGVGVRSRSVTALAGAGVGGLGRIPVFRREAPLRRIRQARRQGKRDRQAIRHANDDVPHSFGAGDGCLRSLRADLVGWSFLGIDEA